MLVSVFDGRLRLANATQATDSLCLRERGWLVRVKGVVQLLEDICAPREIRVTSKGNGEDVWR